MNALDTLQIQDESGSGDLSGTRIVADRRVAVFSGMNPIGNWIKSGKMFNNWDQNYLQSYYTLLTCMFLVQLIC